MLHMEQNLIFQIVSLLLMEKLHARAIARKLKTNHMAISRNIRLLVRENVADFKKEGRNKVYFIKKSIEAKNYACMAEISRLNTLLKKYPELRRIVVQIQQNKNIELAVLFGSYANGTATKTSDIDIFIETKNRKLKEDVEKIDSKLSVKIGLYDKESLLIKEIEKTHVIIKGVETYYEKFWYFD